MSKRIMMSDRIERKTLILTLKFFRLKQNLKNPEGWQRRQQYKQMTGTSKKKFWDVLMMKPLLPASINAELGKILTFGKIALNAGKIWGIAYITLATSIIIIFKTRVIVLSQGLKSMMAIVSNLEEALLAQRRHSSGDHLSGLEAHRRQSRVSQPPKYGLWCDLQNYFPYKISGKMPLT